MIEIPLTSDPAQTFTLTLEGALFEVTIRFNTRWGVWTADLVSDSFSALGIPLVGGVDLLRQYPTSPISDIYIINISGGRLDATAENLGTDIILVIIDEV